MDVAPVLEPTILLDVDPALDICGHSTCPGSELDPEFPALVCTLPVGHDGWHSQEGVNCAWWRDE